MRRQAGMARLDRPWHRPGAVWYALRRLPGLLRPPVSVYEPAAGSLSVLRDLPVVVRDGTTVRVNVVLPAGAGRFPVLMSAHPYSKDNLPQRRSRGYRVSFQYRMLRQPAPVRFSVLTGWEAPDPAWWAARGYAALRSLDEQNSRPFDPVPTLSHRQPLAPGQAVPADIALGPSATLFRDCMSLT